MSSAEFEPDERFDKQFERYQRAMDADDFQDAADAVHEIFELATDWCDSNPSTDLELTLAAAEREEQADWAGAESMYKQILLLPNLEPQVEFKAHTDLVALCQLLHRPSDGLDHARRATTAARRAGLDILLVMALAGESQSLIKCSEFRDARDVIAEALSLIADNQLYNQLHARILILRAECAIHDWALESAERDLQKAFGYLEPPARMKLAAGVHSDLAGCWSVAARLRAERKENKEAITAWRKAVVLAKQVDLQPHCESVYNKARVANMLAGLADALLNHGRADEADSVRAERRRLLSKIGLPDPTAAW